MPAVDVRVTAMGGHAQVIVVDGPPDGVQLAVRRLAELEQLWSRFLSGSDVTRLNRGAGGPVDVDPRTVDLVTHAVEGWATTGGRYDPTVLPALAAAGYDRSFDEIPANRPGPIRALRGGWSAPGCATIDVDRGAGTVTLPAGTGFDPGGIGKGFAADLIVAELLEAGAAGACVNIGGDLVAAGESPEGDGWLIGIENPVWPGTSPWTVSLAAGAVATSSPLGKQWHLGGRHAHHLIDPSSGRPAESDLVSVTVVSADGWCAEVLAKAAYLSGSAEAAVLLDNVGVCGLLIDDGGSHHMTAGMYEVLV